MSPSPPGIEPHRRVTIVTGLLLLLVAALVVVLGMLGRETDEPPAESALGGVSSKRVGVPLTGASWSAEFDDSLDLASPGNEGVWRTTDVWQDVDRGFRDFAGTSWNVNPNELPAHDPFSVDDGVLTIAVQRTPETTRSRIASSMDRQGQPGAVPEWSGGYLVKNPEHREFLYGYFELRVRFRNIGPGMFPAVWLFATGGVDNPDGKGNAEIDILEIFGHPSGRPATSTVHFRDNDGEAVRPSRTVATTRRDPEVWQTYGLDWQPGHLRFYAEGQLVGELTGPDAEWFDTPMSLRLNYAMDAPWFPPERRSGPTTPTELFMDVDYVRVYPTKR